MPSISLAVSGQTSEAYEVGPGARVTASGSGYVQWTSGTLTDVRNGAATWQTWPNGATTGYADTMRRVCIRGVATGALTVTWDEGKRDPGPEGAFWQEQASETLVYDTSSGVVYGATPLLKQRTRYAKPSGDQTGATDAVRLAALASGMTSGGRIELDGGEWYIDAMLPMLPGQYWEGAGTEITRMRPVGTITMFGYSKASGGQEVAWGIDGMTLYGYSNASIAIDTKVSTLALWDVKIGRIYIDGFGNGLGSSTDPVVKIGDPFGFRALETIIEQTGDRPALNVSGNGSSKRDAKIIACKTANNAGHNVTLTNCNGAVVEACSMYTTGASKQNITLSASGLCTLFGNDITCSAAGQYGYVLTDGSSGNTIMGGGVDGQNFGTTTGLGIVIGSDYNVADTILFQCATQVSNAGANNTLRIRP